MHHRRPRRCREGRTPCLWAHGRGHEKPPHAPSGWEGSTSHRGPSRRSPVRAGQEIREEPVGQECRTQAAWVPTPSFAWATCAAGRAASPKDHHRLHAKDLAHAGRARSVPCAHLCQVGCRRGHRQGLGRRRNHHHLQCAVQRQPQVRLERHIAIRIFHWSRCLHDGALDPRQGKLQSASPKSQSAPEGWHAPVQKWVAARGTQ
mmetsp:Transcript_152023/g.369163  ORF Transcript_152023/g.369163 Transcript_152023/m.369163 type:complete len:204 (-) Transcript_152023:152-763(-)